MITKDRLNEDQRKSYDQMTSGGGLDEKRALELIQELCIDKNYTGLKVHAFELTPEGQRVAQKLVKRSKK